MEVIKAIILGIIQGLTEFLPVSSSGHIELGKVVLNYDAGETSLLFTVVLHCATVLSTIVVFRKDILEILKGLFAFKWNEETQFAMKILISMIPVGIVGVLFESQIEAFFNKNLLLVGLMLWFTGCLLYLTGYVEKRQQSGKPLALFTATEKDKKVSFTDALIIGIMQAVAVMPGISRSGSTIATGLLLGVDKSRIARFSFLMVLPPILGATLLKLKDYMEAPQASIDVIPLTAGFVAAFISGLFACMWMIELVKRGKLIYFAIYCFIVGAIAIGYSLLTLN